MTPVSTTHSRGFLRNRCGPQKKREKLFSRGGTSSRPLASTRGRAAEGEASTTCAELLVLQNASVQPCFDSDQAEVNLASLWGGEETHVLFFLSHFGDLTSWEYAQKVRDRMGELTERGASVTVVGLGSVASGKKFAELLKFPTSNLYADPSGQIYKDLDFAQGFLPDSDVSPYVKLLGMLAGVGSPGTMAEVFRGYVGDRDAEQIFDSGPFDILGTGYQRPFELATLRLSNMIGILPNWSELVTQEDLICQQGGTFIFKGEDLVHAQRDAGILKYASIDKVIQALDEA